MRLTHLEARGVAGLPDRRFDFVADTGKTSTTFITGPMGSGKTMLLDAIVAVVDDVSGLGKVSRTRVFPVIGNVSAKLECGWDLSQSEQEARALATGTFQTETIIGEKDAWDDHPFELSFLLRRYEIGASTQKVEYFHAERDLPVRTAVLTHGDSDTSLRRAKDNGKYAPLSAWLLEGLRAEDDAPPRLARLAERFAALAPSKRLVDAFIGSSGIRVTFEDKRGGRMDLNDLSAGERQAFLFAATFERSVLHDSIILIDEPERSIPPRDLPAFFQAVTGFGERNQLIVATESPALLGMTGAGAVISLD